MKYKFHTTIWIGSLIYQHYVLSSNFKWVVVVVVFIFQHSINKVSHMNKEQMKKFQKGGIAKINIIAPCNVGSI